jgi:hypothetical protein
VNLPLIQLHDAGNRYHATRDDSCGSATVRSSSEDGLRISQCFEKRDVGLIDCPRLSLIATDSANLFIRGFVYSADPFVGKLLDIFLEPFEVVSGHVGFALLNCVHGTSPDLTRGHPRTFSFFQNKLSFS